MEPLEKLVTNFVIEVQGLRIQELEKQVSELTEEFNHTTEELIMDYAIKCEELELLKKDKLIDEPNALADAKMTIKELEDKVRLAETIIFNAEYWTGFITKYNQAYRILGCGHVGPSEAPICLDCLKQGIATWKESLVYKGGTWKAE